MQDYIHIKKINKDDTVCIMWSSLAREDRYVNNKWLLSGSIYTQEIYDESFIKQFADPTGYLLRDLSYISASKQILTSLGCKWYFFSIVPLACYEDCIVSWFDIDKKIIDLYKDDIASIRPSVYETIFNNDWHSRIGYRNFNDIKLNYNNCKGASWPTWDNFLIQYNNDSLGKLKNEILIDYKFGQQMIRTDYHPTPIEHLEYLDKIVPELPVTDATRKWVTSINGRLLKLDNIHWYSNAPKVRF